MIDQSESSITRTSSVLLAVLVGIVALVTAIALAVAVTPISWPMVLLILLFGVGAKLLHNELGRRSR